MVYLYHPDKNEWNAVGSQHVAYDQRESFCVSDGRHLYVIGGTWQDPEDDIYFESNAVERFDPSENSWEDVAPMNEARRSAFGAAMNGKIYVAGGLYGEGESLHGTCEVYNPSTNEWQLMPSLNVPRHSASMVCFKEALYVIGGRSGYSFQMHKSQLSVEMFDSRTNEWKKACVETIHRDVLIELEPLTCEMQLNPFE